MKLRFLSRNTHKINEATRILAAHGIELEATNAEVEELQTVDTDRLIRDKALKAFEKVGHPLFVEHTGLYLDMLNEFPGGLTQVFWDRLGREKFSKFFASPTARVVARTHIGYVDGRRIHVFEGEVVGKIVTPCRVDYGFQWDCVFVPNGEKRTFSEMGADKDLISMRGKALQALARFVADGKKP
jgi:XTP/dITP diphosphohydrolase